MSKKKCVVHVLSHKLQARSRSEVSIRALGNTHVQISRCESSKAAIRPWMEAKNENKRSKNILAQLATSMTAGGTARITSICILHPFDVIKTR